MLLWKFVIYPVFAAIFGMSMTVVSSLYAAEIFQCTDEQGGVEVRQTPCTRGTEKSLTVEPQIVPWAKVKSAGRIGSSSPKRSSRPKRKASARSKGVSEKQCWKKAQQLERVQWQLRKGYKPSRGEKLRQKRRELEAFRRKFCR